MNFNLPRLCYDLVTTFHALQKVLQCSIDNSLSTCNNLHILHLVYSFLSYLPNSLYILAMLQNYFVAKQQKDTFPFDCLAGEVGLY